MGWGCCCSKGRRRAVCCALAKIMYVLVRGIARAAGSLKNSEKIAISGNRFFHGRYLPREIEFENPTTRGYGSYNLLNKFRLLDSIKDWGKEPKKGKNENVIN